MPLHLDKSVINIFRIQNFLQVNLRIFKSFRRSYTALAFWGIATRTSYKVHLAPCAFASASCQMDSQSLKEHMDLEQALLHAPHFQLRLLAQRTANFVDVSIEMIMGLCW